MNYVIIIFLLIFSIYALLTVYIDKTYNFLIIHPIIYVVLSFVLIVILLALLMKIGEKIQNLSLISKYNPIYIGFISTPFFSILGIILMYIVAYIYQLIYKI